MAAFSNVAHDRDAEPGIDLRGSTAFNVDVPLK